MANRHVINAEKREVFGKKLSKYRKEGKIPGNIYGKTTDPTPIWFNSKEVDTLLKDVSETAFIDIKIGSEKARPVVLRDIQHHTIGRAIVHIDAQQVNLNEKIQVTVAIEITGESEAVTSELGILENALAEIEIEALPADIPESFIVDISPLVEVGQKITVADLKVPTGVEIITDAEATIVSIVEPQQAEEEVVEKTEAELIEGVEATAEKGEESAEDKDAE